MHRIPNTFADRLKPKFGIPQIDPTPGETFDTANDLWLMECGTRVLHRDGFVTNGSRASVIFDALIDWNRRHMSPRAFAYHYADDPTETGFSAA